MKKIILDVDTGVDDAFAILLSSSSKELDVQAVTTVAGNCTLTNSTRNSLKILDLNNRKDIPVYKGEEHSLVIGEIDATYVHGENGIGDMTFDDVQRQPENIHAVDYLIREVNENPGEITIVAVAPLTNIAKAIQKNSEFSKNIKQLVIMGGSQTSGNVTKYAEFNFRKDPHAAKIVFESGIKDIVMVGLDVTTKIPLVKELEEMLQKINNDVSNFMFDCTRMGAKYDREHGMDGLILNDPLTVAYLIDDSVLELRKTNIEIITEGEKIGMSVINDEKTHNARVAYNVDVNKFYKILFTNIFQNEIEIVNKYIK